MTQHLAHKCRDCHLFIEANDPRDVAGGCAEYVHLHRGDDADEAIDATHEAKPSYLLATVATWEAYGPPAMRARFVPAGMLSPDPDPIGSLLLNGVAWADAVMPDVALLAETVREADAAAEGDSSDAEISALSGAMELALTRWPEVVVAR